MTPWRDGKEKQVFRQDYEPVGLSPRRHMGATGSMLISASAAIRCA
jgi:hypothetical protein